MKQPSDDYELLSQYLLGELSEEEQEAVEKRYLADREVYDKLLVIEDELIDAYVEGALAESRRANLERHFLNTPDRRARVDFGRAWMTYVTQQSGKQRVKSGRSHLLLLPLTKSWSATLRIAAAVVLLFGGAWLISEVVRLRNRVDQAQIQAAELEQRQRETTRQLDEERRRAAALSGEVPGPNNDKSAVASSGQEDRSDQQASSPDHRTNASVVTFILRPGLSRGTAQENKLIIPQGTQHVAFQLSFSDAIHKSYRVVIGTAEGRAIFNTSGLKARSKTGANTLVIPVPASSFANGDYILTLSGLTADGVSEDIAEYAFNAHRK